MQSDTQNEQALRASRRKSNLEERDRQVQQRIADEAARHRATDAKTARLRELRMARDEAEQRAAEAAKAAEPPKKARRAAAKKSGKV